MTTNSMQCKLHCNAIYVINFLQGLIFVIPCTYNKATNHTIKSHSNVFSALPAIGGNQFRLAQGLD